jgi:hypothetical protein
VCPNRARHAISTRRTAQSCRDVGVVTSPHCVQNHVPVHTPLLQHICSVGICRRVQRGAERQGLYYSLVMNSEVYACSAKAVCGQAGQCAPSSRQTPAHLAANHTNLEVCKRGAELSKLDEALELLPTTPCLHLQEWHRCVPEATPLRHGDNAQQFCRTPE